MKKVFALVAVVAAILVVGAACVGVAQKDYDAVVAERDSAQAELQSVTSLSLPEGAIKLSELVPTMGEHWADPATLPLGPIYLVHDEEVIGIEYMWTEDMMSEVSIPTPEGPEVFNALAPLPVEVVVNHVDVAFMPHGHEGFEVPHWDIHMYFISPEERQELVPHGH